MSKPETTNAKSSIFFGATELAVAGLFLILTSTSTGASAVDAASNEALRPQIVKSRAVAWRPPKVYKSRREALWNGKKRPGDKCEAAAGTGGHCRAAYTGDPARIWDTEKHWASGTQGEKPRKLTTRDAFENKRQSA